MIFVKKARQKLNVACRITLFMVLNKKHCISKRSSPLSIYVITVS